jgi:hypothetical protein
MSALEVYLALAPLHGAVLWDADVRQMDSLWIIPLSEANHFFDIHGFGSRGGVDVGILGLSLSLGATGTITVDGSLRVLPSTFLQLRLVPARLRFFDITLLLGCGRRSKGIAACTPDLQGPLFCTVALSTALIAKDWMASFSAYLLRTLRNGRVTSNLMTGGGGNGGWH